LIVGKDGRGGGSARIAVRKVRYEKMEIEDLRRRTDRRDDIEGREFEPNELLQRG
jgi:hypothetical protein